MPFAHTIKVKQQPIRGRMCGIKETADRRRLEPTLVLQLQFESREMEIQYLSKSELFLCHLALVGEDTQEIKSVMELRTQYSYLVQNSLLGNEPIYGTVLTDPDDGLQHIFFVFPNLSVRYSGVFRLCCTVVDLENTVCSQICTDTFTVHSSKTYPGSNKKTELEKCFQKQGHAISRYHIA